MSGIFLKIVNMSISAGWIVLAVLVLRLLLKKAPKWATVLLWAIVGLRLIMPFSIESLFSLVPSSETISMAPDSPRPYFESGIVIVDNQVNEYLHSNYFEGVTRPEGHFIDITTISAIVWLVGIFALLIYTVISYLRIKNKTSTAVLLRDNIFQSENVVSPFVLGIINPKIYLPFDISEQNMEHVIAHENAHINRKDHLWKPLGFLLLTLHWFNPLIWIGYIVLCKDIELACDEKVVKDFSTEKKADYSQALLSCSVNRRMIAACPLAFGEVSVKSRIKSVLNYKKPVFWVVVLTIITVIAVAVCFLTNPESKPDTEINSSDTSSEVESSETDKLIEQLKQTHPHFFNLPCEEGLTLYVWEWARGIYECHLASTELEALRDEPSYIFSVGYASVDEMKAILSTYDIPSEQIIVKAVNNPLSSFYQEITDEFQKEVEQLFGLYHHDIAKIPRLQVVCNGFATQAIMGTTTWSYDTGDGTWSSVSGDSSHPLAMLENYLLPNALQVNRALFPESYVELKFELIPDSIKVNAWFITDDGSAKPFDAEVEGMKIKLNESTETCVYEIVATYNSNPKYNGIVSHSFAVLEKSNIPYDEWGLNMGIRFISETEFEIVFDHNKKFMAEAGILTISPEYEIRGYYNGEAIPFETYMGTLGVKYEAKQFAWDTVLYTIPENKETAYKENLTVTYGSLPVGEYVLLKSVYFETESGDRLAKVYTERFAIVD